ncbi:glycoside hydrolase family 3 protein [Microbacterium laevaniformans]|uniref:Glycoside hydrolase family 3 protein n=1 Tax=Microbacterium laevaniformans TaxID=36807 RepID=A0A4S2D3U5_9MICO|nr:glycoside hydrolase family 3 N-terminal domain-containing protein [Microbacterium laevaniformans]TGY36228.1 glycoside hydrolase family 3 protein [Microbacterium laevaniformans]
MTSSSGLRSRRLSRALRSAAAAAVIALGLAGCGAYGPSPSPSTSAPSPVPTPTPTPTPTVDPLAGLDLRQRVGQLFIVGTQIDAATPATMAAVTDRHAGGIFLHGRSQAAAAAVAALVGSFTSADADGIPLWVSTDQEGGEVQVLTGPGFDDIPYAIRQADLPDDQLRASATTWGQQLAAAGVTLNLAPVADIVTSEATRFDNPPIGALGRQYGYDEATVVAKAGAFADGMRASRVMPVFKHFPGLGHVTANTDTAADVVDTTVTADGPDVAVYRRLLQGGPAAVMVSSAIYQDIDPSAPAVFSPTVVGLARSLVGPDAMIVTDDLSAAQAVQAWSPADRAVLAVSAGVDVVLASTDPSVFAAMYDAVLAKAQTDPAFAQRVDDAARHVLAAKTARP